MEQYLVTLFLPVTLSDVPGLLIYSIINSLRISACASESADLLQPSSRSRHQVLCRCAAQSHLSWCSFHPLAMSPGSLCFSLLSTPT